MVFTAPGVATIWPTPNSEVLSPAFTACWVSSLVAGGVQREGAGSRGEDRLAKADSLFLGSPLCLIEVFSPRIRTLLKGVVEAAGQSCGQPSGTLRSLGSGSAKRHSRLRWRSGLICNDASLRRPRTANPGEKPYSI